MREKGGRGRGGLYIAVCTTHLRGVPYNGS